MQPHILTVLSLSSVSFFLFFFFLLRNDVLVLLNEVLMHVSTVRFCCVSKWCVVGVYVIYPDMSCQLFGPYSFWCLET